MEEQERGIDVTVLVLPLPLPSEVTPLLVPVDDVHMVDVQAIPLFFKLLIKFEFVSYCQIL